MGGAYLLVQLNSGDDFFILNDQAVKIISRQEPPDQITHVTLPQALLVPPTLNLAMACGPSWMLMPLARFRLGRTLGGALSESSEELKSSKCPDKMEHKQCYKTYVKARTTTLLKLAKFYVY